MSDDELAQWDHDGRRDIGLCGGRIVALVAEVRLLRGLLADACLDSRLVARVVVLRQALRSVAAAAAAGSHWLASPYADLPLLRELRRLADAALAADAGEAPL